LSAAPDSFAVAAEQAFPARSNAEAEGVQTIVAAALAVLVLPLAVPRVMVIALPLWVIVELVKLTVALEKSLRARST
jgi:hypothetical protein